MNNLIKLLFCEKLIDLYNKDEIFENNKINLSADYGMFKCNIEPLEYKKYNFTLPFDTFIEIPQEIKNYEHLLEFMELLVEQSNFYGAIYLKQSIYDKEQYTPKNLFSLTDWIHFKNDFKNIKKLYCFFIEDENIIKQKLNQKEKDEFQERFIDLIDSFIQIKYEKTDNKIMVCKAPKELEDLGLHLSDLHKYFSYKPNFEELFILDEQFLLNTEYGDTDISELLSNNSITIELQSIDIGGSVVPAYGLWSKNNNLFKPLIHIMGHPNISENNYCTGVNIKTSLKGITELTYGNLTSPLTSNIWNKKSFAYIREWQKMILKYIKA